MKANFKNIIIFVLVVAVIIVASSFMMNKTDKEDKFLYSDLIDLFEKDLVRDFVIDEKGTITLNAFVLKENEDGSFDFELDDKGEKKVKEYTYSFSIDIQIMKVLDIVDANMADGESNLQKYDIEPLPETPWYLAYLPYIITGLLFIGLTIFLMRQTSGGAGKAGGFAKSKAKLVTGEKNQVKFDDVAGADEEKAELEEVVEFLKDPGKFVKLGARIPRGVLLVGPPGTGKTLLAKAVAGEAGVPFFSISGSDFVEMYVGVGASRVRDLFDNARKTPASIIFIDEIDAVGRHRGAGLGGGHDEREQTLNQLLVEMDGFGSHDGIIVIAATNRPDILDPALLRPGRFDRQITVNYPDMKGREDILHVHAKGKPFENTVDFHKIAQTTVGFTGADLANLLNEAALLAARRGKNLIGMDEIEESYMKIIVGPKKKSKVREEKDNRLTAFHEAGHAVAAFYCENTDPVKHITIIPAGRTGGVTVRIPEKDASYDTRNSMFDDIVVSLGGRVAEQLNLGDISTGASSDIQHATAIARNMVTRYGMSDKLGPILYGSEHSSDEVFLGRDFSSGKNYSEATAAEIDQEIKAIIDRAYKRCTEILTLHADKLSKLAEYLLKVETVDGDQFKALMERDASFDELDEIAKDKQRKSERENDIRRQMEENDQRKRDEERARRDEEMHNRDIDGMSVFGQRERNDERDEERNRYRNNDDSDTTIK